MATKVYDSPTTNIFALLAEEHTSSEPQAKKTKDNASKGPVAELTPKERAEAKAVQDAARKAQRDADKAKQEAEASRRKALELIDDSGFAPQRHQRIKENRIQERTAEVPKSPKSPKSKSKEGWGDNKKGGASGWDNKKGGEGKAAGSGWANKTHKDSDDKSAGKTGTESTASKGASGWDNKNKGTGGNKGGNKASGWDKTVDNKSYNKGDKSEGKGFPNKGEGKGKPTFNKGEGKGPHRQGLDKHSQSTTSRQFQPKKAGHGKANWDETVPAGLNAGPVQDALASEALAAPNTGEVDGWGDSPATATETGDVPATDADAAEKDVASEKKKDDEDEDENKRTLDDFLADQEKKRLALEAKIGSAPQTRELSDEEKKALTKFTLVENSKAVKKPEAKTTTPKTAATTVQPAGARKGEKPFEESLLSFRVAGARAGGGGRGRGNRFGEGSPPPRDNTGRGGPRKGGRGPQKILKGKNEFPDLGPK